jgi:nucleoside-triphosphatase THEP1
MPTETALPIAAIVYSPTDNVEALLLQAARTLAGQGVKLGGVLQHDIATVIPDPCAMELEDLASGERFSLSQDLGSGSEACRLDPASLAHAAVAVRAALADGAQLVVINKFGAQEASGCGLRAEMGEVALAGVPLLTAVGARFLPEWQHFTGGAATLLEPKLEDILAWWTGLTASA